MKILVSITYGLQDDYKMSYQCIFSVLTTRIISVRNLLKMMKLNAALIFLLTCCISVRGLSNTKHYVVYMGEHNHPSADAVISANHAMLASVTGSEDEAKVAAIHHYSKSFRGFSAVLTPEQASLLQECDEVISVFESKTSEVHSTRSWDFLGVNLPTDLRPEIELESDVIVASIDTGIWPESDSFNDAGLGPAPTRFKGECVAGENFTLENCNRKIIGARYYFKGFETEFGALESNSKPFFQSARDADGHGTHVASTILGSVTPYASLPGKIASGATRGGAIGARLAVYKACWFSLCTDADVLSALDDAVADGVDIISISAGHLRTPPHSFFQDAYSIGSFHAFRKNIIVISSAGNHGPGIPGTAGNVFPWTLTVAASSIDRQLNSYIYLGNSKVLRGTSLNPTELAGNYPIITAAAAAAQGVPATSASFCKKNTLDHKLVAGKIVVCTIEVYWDFMEPKAVEVQEAGGVGMILVAPMLVDVAFSYVIPSSLIGANEAEELNKYLNSERYPNAKISKTTTVLKTTPAPQMFAFSPKGPNVITPDIIKPDITAPGVNILGAWSPVALVGNRAVDYNIISGTSVACPHVSGAAAIIKSRHKSWSPAAIMSALMTTATLEDNTHGPILRSPNGTQSTPFDYGSGHLNTVAALNPGLVYNFGPKDVIDFLCGNGATPADLKNLTGEATKCTTPLVPSYNFNYPSIGVAAVTGKMTVYRTVTNVHEGNWVYGASVENPEGVHVNVVPEKLEFSQVGERKSFRIELVPSKPGNGNFVFGSITWSDGTHKVRSPIGLNVVAV